MNLVSLNESTLYISVSLVNVEPVFFKQNWKNAYQ